MYNKMAPDVHSEESVLAFLMKCKDKRDYKATTLWTVRSLILCYLRLELKVEVLDTRTSKWLKKLSGIMYNML